jgi:hypothetical protein
VPAHEKAAARLVCCFWFAGFKWLFLFLHGAIGRLIFQDFCLFFGDCFLYLCFIFKTKGVVISKK